MQKHVNDYLQNLLTNYEDYMLTEEDIKKVSRDKAQFITDKFTLKKYRRRKLTEETKKAIYNKVAISIKEDRPIHFVVPFGGYKHFWNPSYPEPDWAELFNFRFLTGVAAPAIAVHKPGVIIEYMSEDMILNRMNNYQKAALEQYSEIFRKLIEWYNKQTPKSLDFQFFRVKERCNAEEIIKQVEALLPERKKAFDKLSEEEKNRELHRSYRSVYWDGEEDWTNLSETEKQEKIIQSRLIELAYYDTEAKPEHMGDYLGGDNHICICFSFGTTHDNDAFQDLTLASTYGSLVDHWIGRGILEKRGDKLSPRIYSREQYEDVKDKLKSVDVDGLLPYKNYKQIEISAV